MKHDPSTGEPFFFVEPRSSFYELVQIIPAPGSPARSAPLTTSAEFEATAGCMPIKPSEIAHIAPITKECRVQALEDIGPFEKRAAIPSAANTAVVLNDGAVVFIGQKLDALFPGFEPQDPATKTAPGKTVIYQGSRPGARGKTGQIFGQDFSPLVDGLKDVALGLGEIKQRAGEGVGHLRKLASRSREPKAVKAISPSLLDVEALFLYCAEKVTWTPFAQITAKPHRSAPSQGAQAGSPKAAL